MASSPLEPVETTGARHLVKALETEGVDRIFCVPGESFLAVLDALHDSTDIAVITCRHEGGAAMMAEADGKLTGRPGICMVTRGPGATNASAGIHVASQDATPMIVFIGQVARGFMGREAFQEVDYTQLFGTVAKWVAQIDDAARIPEFIARAFAVAMSGRPGPVVLALPEDMLTDVVRAVAARRTEVPEIYPAPAQIAALQAMLEAAERPVLIPGGSRWTEAACAALTGFAERWELPVAASWRRQDLFSNAHRCYAGEAGLGINPKLKARIQAADLVILMGDRLSEVPSDGYELLAVPRPTQTLVHIHADANELGHVYQADLAINATPLGMAPHLDALAPKGKPRWAETRAEARAQYEAWQTPRQLPGDVQVAEVMLSLREKLPEDAILTNGAGNFAAFLHRFYRHRRYGTQLAPGSGSMGYGVPAAVAAKLRHPDRRVVCVAGDGDFMMTGQELATALQFGAAPIFIVVDNGMLGTIRMHQERHYPGRVAATTLQNPDFAAYGRAFGARGEVVDRTEDFSPAFERALGSDKPTVIHLKVDPEALTAGQSLSEIRAAAQKG
jgi:acetolactate synthase-1/2/3 large subunit